MKEKFTNRERNTGLLANALGWLSVGIGVAELVAPKTIGRLIGKSEYPGIIRGVGVRELINGLGILSQRGRTAWLWGRVGGDILHAAAMAATLPGPDCKEARRRSFGTMAVAGGAALIDATAAYFSGKTQKRAIHVSKSIEINKSPEELYRFWHQFENLPRFMKNLESVQSHNHHSHWVAKAPVGTKIEWDADIIDEVPDRLIAWKTVENSPVYHSGVVRFEPTAIGTNVQVELDYIPPAGALGEAFAKLSGKAPDQQIESDLQDLKRVMESQQQQVSTLEPLAEL